MLDPETPPDAGFLTYAFASRDYLSDLGDFRPYVEVLLRNLAGDFDGDRMLRNGTAHRLARRAGAGRDGRLAAGSLIGGRRRRRRSPRRQQGITRDRS